MRKELEEEGTNQIKFRFLQFQTSSARGRGESRTNLQTAPQIIYFLQVIHLYLKKQNQKHSIFSSSRSVTRKLNGLR